MLSRLFTDAARTWSIGSTLAETLFEGGLRHAQVEQARAAYDGAIANYRQTVLAAFQQVEDQLAALRILADQQRAADAAAAAAREAERIISNQYKAGTVAYTNVVVAQTAALANAETALNVRQSRLVASVALIQALGGGWDVSGLPSKEQIETDVPLNFSPLPPDDAWPKLPNGCNHRGSRSSSISAVPAQAGTIRPALERLKNGPRLAPGQRHDAPPTQTSPRRRPGSTCPFWCG